MPKIRKTLGEFLLENKIISGAQLQTAHLESDKTGEVLSHVLVRLGLVPEDKILDYYKEQCNIPRADLKTIDPQAVPLISEKTARKYHLIPVTKKENKLNTNKETSLDRCQYRAV